jgi:hypothetical protein
LHEESGNETRPLMLGYTWESEKVCKALKKLGYIYDKRDIHDEKDALVTKRGRLIVT